MGKIDHQGKVWGESPVRLSPKYLGFLRLKYTLDDLKEVRGNGSTGSPPRVLDAGCGGGGFAKAVKHYRDDLEVYGVDIAKSAIAGAKKFPGGVKFQVGDLYKLPFEDGFFDAVVVEDVLEHLEKPYLALAEINRVLKRNSVFSAFIPLEGSFFSLHFWLEKLGWKAKEKHAGHIQKYNKKDVESSMKYGGFEILDKRYSTHLLGQVVDVGFFTLMDWLGNKLSVGLEHNLKDKPVHRFLKNTITRLTNLDSQIFNFVPGAGIHLKCLKRS